MGRVTVVLFALASAAFAASTQGDGEALFRESEFKAAARTFERSLTKDPGNARLHYWLGKSYARMAEVSSLVSAHKNARKARTHLETAVQLDPGNRVFLMELFEFYVDSPEYFDGGLSRAAGMLERLGPDDGGPASPSRIVADARREYRGASWVLRKGVLRFGAVTGYLIP